MLQADEPTHSAATIALAKKASYSPSSEIVLTYSDRKSFMNEKNRLRRHFLHQARKYSPAAVPFVEQVLQVAETLIYNAGQMERWFRRNKTQEEKEAHPEWLRLCYYMDKVIHGEIARKPLDTLLRDVIHWEANHPLTVIRDWNTFFPIARLIRNLHKRLMKHYRFELGDMSSTPFEDTVIGVVFRIFLEMDVMSSPDETSLQQTLSTLDFVLSLGSIRDCRRSKDFIPTASSLYRMSPSLVPSRDIRWLKPRWTVPETETEVDRPEDLQLFTDAIELFDVHPPYVQESTAAVEAIVFHTLQEAQDAMARAEPEYFKDASGQMYRLQYVGEDMLFRRCDPPPEWHQQPSTAQPPRSHSKRVDNCFIPPHPYAAPSRSVPRRRRRQPRRYSAH